MDINMSKFLFLCTICNIIELMMCVPLEESFQNHNTRVKKSAMEPFSLGFGFKSSYSAPSPIKKVGQTINNFGSIFTPVSFLPQNTGRKGVTYNSKPFVPPIIMGELYQNDNSNSINQNYGIDTANKETSQPSGQLEKQKKLITENITPNKTNYDGIENKGEKKLVDNKVKDKNLKVSDITTQSTDIVNKEEVNKQVLDYIFKGIPDSTLDSTTVDITTEYTTETDDYETTTDSLLRIAAPVVASLLG